MKTARNSGVYSTSAISLTIESAPGEIKSRERCGSGHEQLEPLGASKSLYVQTSQTHDRKRMFNPYPVMSTARV